nr:CU044_5270 family protein [Actinomadura oligospora]
MLPPPRRDLVDHDAVRDQLLRETRQMPTRTRSPRLILGGLAVTLAAGAAAAAVVIVPSGGKGGNGGDEPTITPVAATEVLDRASKAAGELPDVTPRGDQYLYMASKSRQYVSFINGKQEVDRRSRMEGRVEWRSIDGRHAGLMSQTGMGDTWMCDNSSDYEAMSAKAKAAGTGRPKVNAAKPPKGCHDTPAMVTGLPTTQQAMRSWLYEHSQGGNPADVQAFITMGDTVRDRYLRPSSLALMFKAAGTIPGVTVTRDVTDLAGRKGIAIGQTFNGTRRELVFDPKTYRYLGDREYVSHKDSHKFPRPSESPSTQATASTEAALPEGTLLYSYALLKVAVTDKVKQTPR